MTPNDKNIIETLNLLSLLFRSRKQHIPRLSEAEECTLTVTKEHLGNTSLSIPVFINTLAVLSDKGYLQSLSIFEDSYNKEIRKFHEDENYNETIERLEKSDSNKLTIEQKSVLWEDLIKKMPANVQPSKSDKDEFLNEDIKITDLLNDAKSAFNDNKDGDVAKVVLLPFRDINKALAEMNNGKSFDEIQDLGTWYNAQKYEFHIGDKIISTYLRGKPSIEHFVLERLEDGLKYGEIDYDDIDEYKNRSIKDALLRFTKKHPRLEKIFTVHSDNVKINKEYLD